MRDCMREVQGWMEAAGMQVKIDAAGNLRGRYAGASTTTLMIGSHLDTVPNSGAFDGVLGVMLGLALVESLKEKSCRFPSSWSASPKKKACVIRLPFIGSRALVGRVDADFLAHQDGDGISLAQALTSFGLDPRKINRLRGERRCCRLPGVPHRAGHPAGKRRPVPRRGARDCRTNPRGNHLYRPGAATPARHRCGCATMPWRARRSGWCEVERLALEHPGPGGNGRRSAHPSRGRERRSRPIARQPRCAPRRRRHSSPGCRIPCLPRRTSIAKRRGLTVASRMLMDQPAVPMDSRYVPWRRRQFATPGSNRSPWSAAPAMTP